MTHHDTVVLGEPRSYADVHTLMSTWRGKERELWRKVWRKYARLYPTTFPIPARRPQPEPEPEPELSSSHEAAAEGFSYGHRRPDPSAVQCDLRSKAHGGAVRGGVPKRR